MKATHNRHLLKGESHEHLNQRNSRLTGRLIDVYQVKSRIGAGGIGEVYLARDTRLGRDVAIKILSARALGDPSLLARFQRE